MNNRLLAILAVTLVVALGVMSSVFTVSETERAIKFRFGEIVATDFEPGLHFRIPLVHTVRKYDKRLLTLENRAEEFLTGEKKVVEVDFFVKWRIDDVAQYYRATQGNEGVAAQRLLAILKDGLRSEFARRTVKEVVSADRREIMEVMTVNASQAAREFGVQIVDVRVKKIELPDEVLDSAFKRMRTERERIAKQLRAEGVEAAERIRAGAERERTVILAEAYREAQRIRGEGDAQAAEIYARAYGQDPEFYAFYRSLLAYRRALGGGNDVLVLEPDSEFFKYFKRDERR
ncbi:MAG TPA: protease modulator HflC [Gammaproteobacteria bacterium]|nr:protease modulator HflC [Gammaproteobacteria bacterium]